MLHQHIAAGLHGLPRQLVEWSLYLFSSWQISSPLQSWLWPMPLLRSQNVMYSSSATMGLNAHQMLVPLARQTDVKRDPELT